MNENPRAGKGQPPDDAPGRVPIRIDGKVVIAPQREMTGAAIRQLTVPPISDDRDLWLDKDGPVDDLVEDNDVVRLSPQTALFTVPRIITPGSSDLANDDAAYLASLGITHSVSSDDSGLLVVLHEFEVPAGLEPRHTDVLIRLPSGFPDAAPDMFWCDPPLQKSGGSPPPGTEGRGTFLGRTWQRWSRHIGGNWRPGMDGLASYLAYLRRCLAMASEQAA